MAKRNKKISLPKSFYKYSLIWSPCECVCLCVLPLHALYQRHLVGRGGYVEGGGPALVDASLDAVHRLLLLHLHRVAEAQRPEEQVLVLLEAERGHTQHAHNMYTTCTLRLTTQSTRTHSRITFTFEKYRWHTLKKNNNNL